MCLHCPQDVTPTLPPISTLSTPYASSHLPLNMLRLPRRPQDMPLTLPLPLLMPSPTHLIFSSTCIVPSQHAPDASLMLNTAYHPYTSAAPSR
ncbi:hypothetical protein O181_057660 [Austropuccinia psidii MF-1]|uniref:Uncharacterized protein n=1 Tax=Austropuccinia psidii MF-1 TaxID=1389203 RepID=A0A9Q3HX70_9BASI|nr:hypothetical protein [Austropuccinia psidii MF-1]